MPWRFSWTLRHIDSAICEAQKEKFDWLNSVEPLSQGLGDLRCWHVTLDLGNVEQKQQVRLRRAHKVD